MSGTSGRRDHDRLTAKAAGRFIAGRSRMDLLDEAYRRLQMAISTGRAEPGVAHEWVMGR